MVSFISSWAKEIIVALIIVIVFELIIPKGKNKKYIELVMGLFILYAIINPVTGKKLNLSSIIEKYDDVPTSNINTVKSMDIIDGNVESVYEKKLKESMIQTLKEKGYEVNSIDFEINYNEGEEYGNIEKMKISIKKAENFKNEIKVKKVDIKAEHNDEKPNDEEYEKIKDIIFDMYSINKEKIIIE
ncbi:MAG: stage III sporulation protein AF [Clostridia bacterium]|nr:stage III sporulation protein AF [Clostridia bacterium]